jgi:nucleoside-diphosphate-sugar epimerase
MKIFLAGASGALGRRLVPLLIGRGHGVTGTTRSGKKAAEIRGMGAEAVVLDALDRAAVRRAVTAARPEVVVHELTALAEMRSLRNFDDALAATNRLRTEGLDYLLEAARESGARRFVAQSYSGWPNERTGAPVKTEEDPLDANPPQSMSKTIAAIRRLEATVNGATDLDGVVLRYGAFYGPGTGIGAGGAMLEAVLKRQFPVVGGGTGIWSFIHIDDAASATAAAIEGGPGGIYNIVDDKPAPVAVWLPELARAAGAPGPYRLPRWIGRLMIGDAGISMMTEVRGSSNAKAKRVWNWQPRYASWRDGFRNGLSIDEGRAPELVRSRRAS